MQREDPLSSGVRGSARRVCLTTRSWVRASAVGQWFSRARRGAGFPRLRDEVFAERRQELSPPQAERANELRCCLPMTRGMIRPNLTPAAVRQRDQGSAGTRVETHLDLCRLMRCEVD